MNRLYRVTVEYEILVAAESEDEAERVADRNLHEAVSGTDPDLVLVSEITEAEQIPHTWRGCPPYGGDVKRTVEQYFEVTP